MFLIEDRVHFFRRDTDAGVFHLGGHQQHPGRCRLRHHPHGDTTLPRKLDGVAQQVGQNLFVSVVVDDDRPGQAPNAFQTLDKNGRPVLAFNIPLIATVRNADELAFVMGHEAAHHIQEHLARQQVNATAGALIFGGLAAITGGGEQIVQTAQQVGATVGARGYSKDFELEADRLGTVISHKAGYDPVRGAAFFTRIPDPGNTFLGTHPPNALRINTVRKTAAKL